MIAAPLSVVCCAFKCWRSFNLTIAVLHASCESCYIRSDYFLLDFVSCSYLFVYIVQLYIFVYCDYLLAKMSDCSVCSAPVQQTRSKILCCDCKKFCHANCVGMTKTDIDCVAAEKQVWRCPPCAKVRRKSMAAVSAAEEGSASISQVIFMLDEAREDRKRMEGQFNVSFEFAHNKIDDQKKIIEEQTKKLDEYLEMITKITQENVDLKKKVREMEVRLEDVEQYSRANTVEIYGVPEVKGEDVYDVVKNICVALNMDTTREKIDVCHRLGKRKPQEGEEKDERPAGIIARFVRREDKLTLLKNRKVKRNLSTEHLGFKQLATPIYINESLSPQRRKLYAAAREAKNKKDYTYLWVSNGRILMRKEQGSSVVHVSTMDDLKKL